MDRPLLALPLQGRPDRRCNGFHCDHHLQQLVLAPQRGDAVRPQRRLLARLWHAGYHSLQPLRPEAGAADAQVQTRVHTCGQQRFYAVGDVRHWGKWESHH